MGLLFPITWIVPIFLRKSAFFSLGCAAFVFACAIAVFFIK